MKKVFFALISSLFINYPAFAKGNVEQYRKDCLAFISKPKVELVYSYGKLRYNFDKDSAYLKKEAQKRNALTPETDVSTFETLGFTKVKDVFDFDFSVAQLNMGKGYVCLYPEVMKAKLEYLLPTIYIANNLKEGSCLYDLTMRHEQTHMQIYIEALDYIVPKLKAFMENQINDIGVLVVSDKESLQEAAERLNKAYLTPIQQYVENWRQEVNSEQRKMDSPEHYILESKICAEVSARE